jgi:hypothetical protein
MWTINVNYWKDNANYFNLTISVSNGTSTVNSTQYKVNSSSYFINDLVKFISFGNYGYPRIELITNKTGSVPALQRSLVLDYTSLLPTRVASLTSVSWRINFTYVGGINAYFGSFPITYENNGAPVTTTVPNYNIFIDTIMSIPPPDQVLSVVYLVSRKLSDDNASYDRSAYFMGSSICMSNYPQGTMIITSTEVSRYETPRTSTSDTKTLSVYSDNDTNGHMILSPRFTSTTGTYKEFIANDTTHTLPHFDYLSDSVYMSCETSATSLPLSITSGQPIPVPGGGVKFPGYYANVSPNSFTRQITGYDQDGSIGTW